MTILEAISGNTELANKYKTDRDFSSFVEMVLLPATADGLEPLAAALQALAFFIELGRSGETKSPNKKKRK